MDHEQTYRKETDSERACHVVDSMVRRASERKAKIDDQRAIVSALISSRVGLEDVLRALLNGATIEETLDAINPRWRAQ